MATGRTDFLNPVRLSRRQIPEAAKVLARAFADDPFQRYVFPDSRESERLSPVHFSAIIRYGDLAGEVWTTEGVIAGVTVFLPPSHREMDERKMREAGLLDLPSNIGPLPAERFTKIMDQLEPYHRRDAPVPHWYTMVIGVEPSMQGKGVASSLLNTMFERADRERVPCYLETSQPKNVQFYQRHQFEVLVNEVDPRSGLRFWTFRRQPHKQVSKKSPDSNTDI